ncbi:hypothetical protein A2U01_0062040, partial [Trifolium medium]|nr:hypothetical protein [Trifolium medium]
MQGVDRTLRQTIGSDTTVGSRGATWGSSTFGIRTIQT